jgi:RNA polymerase sigma-B factor
MRRQRSREDLIESHLPLARALAARYHHGPEPMEDLVQVAAMGLVKAADRWDPDRGFAFSTFAVPTILGELRRHFRDATWDVRPPRGLQERSLALERAWNTLLDRHGREPTVAQLAEGLQLAPAEVVEGLSAMRYRKLPSLDAPARAADEAIVVGDTVGSEDEGYARTESQDAFDRLIGRLGERDRTMLSLRFQHDLRQAEIGRRIGLSQMQVSRLIRAALETLAAAPELRAAT